MYSIVNKYLDPCHILINNNTYWAKLSMSVFKYVLHVFRSPPFSYSYRIWELCIFLIQNSSYFRNHNLEMSWNTFSSTPNYTFSYRTISVTPFSLLKIMHHIKIIYRIQTICWILFSLWKFQHETFWNLTRSDLLVFRISSKLPIHMRSFCGIRSVNG